ncbi:MULTISPECIES: hypothetical protein [Prauserella salsuginis group]|uniref:MFS transporter n=2 Tax=Prauserella salsuginis group TaxID=2893672 RepID=A0A839XNL1_9PSEU|nr:MULTISPECIES: hypothetical protein [Prauserella salsuginis group]MBB3664331.1 hypothetical protein [Prauserella sediminis]MCR3721782.1 hypothetical protein [Prauserella flava]MCR3734473.1 hypothetical protein [Prauserella salsuginis]
MAAAGFPPIVGGLAQPGAGAWFVGGALAALGHGMTVYNIVQVSYRQAICPDRLLGRVTAGIRFLAWGTAPVGALGGGVLGETIGLRATVWVFAGITLGAAVLLVLSPLRTAGTPAERAPDAAARPGS